MRKLCVLAWFLSLGLSYVFVFMVAPEVPSLQLLHARVVASHDHDLIQECTNRPDNVFCTVIAFEEVNPHLQLRLRHHRVSDAALCEDTAHALSFRGLGADFLDGLWQMKCAPTASIDDKRSTR